jgi:hypothetical protein
MRPWTVWWWDTVKSERERRIKDVVDMFPGIGGLRVTRSRSKGYSGRGTLRCAPNSGDKLTNIFKLLTADQDFVWGIIYNKDGSPDNIEIRYLKYPPICKLLIIYKDGTFVLRKFPDLAHVKKMLAKLDAIDNL